MNYRARKSRAMSYGTLRRRGVQMTKTVRTLVIVAIAVVLAVFLLA